MKLLSLNLWGGRQGSLLFDYIKDQAKSVDVFCFQEVFDSTDGVEEYKGAKPNLLSLLKNALAGFNGYYAPAYEGWIDMEKADFSVSEGQAIFVKKGIEVLEQGQEYIFGSRETVILENFQNEPKILQYAKIQTQGKEFLVVNVHGMWYPGKKLDTPERLAQSEKILGFLEKFNLPKIICGDFNLMPETQSVRVFEVRDFRNLITEFKIENTRNKVSWDHFGNKQYFADFAFVSKDVEIEGFEVPYNEVSDHLPLLLDFA